MTKFWHIATKDEIEDSLNTDFERGMTNEFAQSKLKQSNNSKKGKKNNFKLFTISFSSVMAMLLVILSVVFMFSGKLSEGITLVVLTLISEALGCGQELAAYLKKEKAKKLLNPKTVVIRDGESRIILSEEVVPGDIVVLKKGDIVPCDGRIVSATDLEVNEKNINGNENVKKDAEAELTEETPAEEQTNMVFAGSSIILGECTVVACKTGKDTLIGETEAENDEQNEKSFMQDKVSEVAKVLATVTFILVVILLLLAWISGTDMWQAGALCLALGAVLVPAKITSVVSYIVNRGILKIADSGSVVKKEKTYENLALCDVVITGKSGILTKEDAKVKAVYTYDDQWGIEDMGLNGAQKSIQGILLEFAAICTGSADDKNTAEEYSVDKAILDAAKSIGIKTDGIEVANSYSFDPERKIMTATAKAEEGYRIITKGNVKEILERSKQAVASAELYEMTDEIKSALLEKCENAAQNGFKTIAVAYKDSDELLTKEDAEKDLIFVGTLLLENEIRKESVKAVSELASAGIKTVVATYDTVSVAELIAAQAGIKKEEDLLLTGEEIKKLSDEELDEKIENVSVFAELTPEDKEKIANSYKRIGKTVCVIADSARDAKIFEISDISVAKKDGSDVTSQNADVVTDGSFTDFVNTVKKCQALYLDVRKALRYMIVGGLALVLFVIFALALTSRLSFAASQVLATGILVSGIMPFALPAGGAWNNFKLKNVKKQNSVFLDMWTRILTCGIFAAIIALVLYIYVRFFANDSSDALALASAQTAAFIYLVFSALFNISALRINAIKLKEGTKELICLASVALLSILVAMIVTLVPAVKNLFGFDGKQILVSVLLAILPVVFGIVLNVVNFKKKSTKAEEVNGADI